MREQVLPGMKKNGLVVAWIVDDTGFPKKGKHSVGVAHQYCGQLGKQENCRVAVSLSVATWSSSLPIGYRLYLPKEWAEDGERREKTEVPEEIEFQTKPEIALDQIRAAVATGVARGTSALGKSRPFALTRSDPHEEHDLPGGKKRASDIIHAEGVRFAVPSRPAPPPRPPAWRRRRGPVPRRRFPAEQSPPHHLAGAVTGAPVSRAAVRCIRGPIRAAPPLLSSARMC